MIRNLFALVALTKIIIIQALLVIYIIFLNREAQSEIHKNELLLDKLNNSYIKAQAEHTALLTKIFNNS